jgi:hypothetical protein
MPARPFRVGEPGADRFGLVGRQVVQYDMNIEVGRDVDVDPSQECEHVRCSVTAAGVVEHDSLH